MAKFKDSAGGEWEIKLTLGSQIALKNKCGVDLKNFYKPGNSGSEAFSKLFADPFTVGAALWVFCEQQAKARNIDEPAFHDLLGGEQIREGMIAIAEALIAFNNPTGAKPAADKMREKLEQAEGEAAEKFAEALDAAFAAKV